MTLTNKIVTPFTVVQNSQVTGGYADQLHTEFYPGTEIVNYHEDQYLVADKGVNSVSIPLQGPFTEQWVGGRQHRHVVFNTGSDNATNRQEAWHITFPTTGVIRVNNYSYLNSPPAIWSRGGRTKSPVNIQNIKTTDRLEGNFSKNYQILQTVGRRTTNNLVVDDLTASSGLTTQFITGVLDYSLPDLSTGNSSKSVFVELFNAPGSKEESTRRALDREGEEMSPNIPLPFRNIKIRQPYYRQLAQHTPQFGSGSTYALLPATGNVNTVTVHKVHRNPLQKGSKTTYDNWFVQHAIPRNDIQYSWITSSAYTTANELGGYQSFQKANESGSSYNLSEAFTDIEFLTGSLVVSGSNTQYEVDNNYLKSVSKGSKVVDITTNTFSLTGSGPSSSFSEITNTNYTFGTFESMRLGEKPVARALRKNNIISVTDPSIPKKIKTDGGRIVDIYPRRGNTSTNYIDPPVTFKYKPLEHIISIDSEDGEQYKIVHEYTNTLSTYANKDLLARLDKKETGSRYYDILREQYRAPESTGVYYQGHKYREVVWPREENTGLSKTRKREEYILDQPGFERDGYDRQLGTQRVFWRDSQEDRKRSRNSEGGYYNSLNYLSTEETGSDFTQNETGVLSNNKFVTFDFNFVQDSGLDSGLFNSIALLETGSIEREIYSFSGSIESFYATGYTEIQQVLNSVNKRGYTFDISGEFGNSYNDFYEQILDKTTGTKRSLGTLYRNTAYKSLLTSLPEDRSIYEDLASKTEDEEILLNPKLRYLSFVGGAELNTGSFVQNENNFNELSTLNFDKFNARVHTLLLSGSDIYVGGAFTQIGDKLINYVAKWDGNEWSAVGNGFNSVIYTLLLSGSDIYAGGTFTTTGSRVSRWDGANWNPVGGGLNNTVRTLLLSGSDIYAGGQFTTTGSYISRWNGISWNPVGGGFNNFVNTLMLSGNFIYAGGSFTTTGSKVSRWNGTNWSAVVGGFVAFGETVSTLMLSGSDIYAGGNFTSSGSRVSRWNGTIWNPVGGGLNDTVTTLVLSGSDIYAGGAFTTTGSRISRWDGANWNPVGDGMDSIIDTLIVSGSDIYAVGNFETTGSRVSRWDGTNWNKITSNQQTQAYQTFADNYHDQVFNKSQFLFSTIDNGIQRTAEEDSGKKPFFNSYEDFIEDIRGFTKNYSIIPEFRISQHMDYYIKQNDKNFLADNNVFLEIDGASDDYRSSLTEKDDFNQIFFSSYVTTDLFKKEKNIREQEQCDLGTVNLTVSGIKKLLPYNGFYPQDRTVQLANLYGEYVENKLHGGIYNLSYRNDYFTDIAILTNETSSPNSISVVQYNDKYFMAIGYRDESTSGRVRIYSSSVNDPTSWSSSVVKEISGSSTSSNADFGQKVQLISASNGLNLFINADATGSTGTPGYILVCSSSNGSVWSEPNALQVSGTSPSVYISGSSGGSAFGNFFDILLDKNNSQEKIIMLIGSPTAGAGFSFRGELYTVTASLVSNQWHWSDKNLVYTGVNNNNRAGTGTSIISCSSGYQIFFAEAEGDLPGSNLGNLLVSTSSNGETWSSPVAISSGSSLNSDIGTNNIKASNFKNKTYVFFSEPASDLLGIVNNGAVFCITSSYNNQWPTSTTFLNKKIVYYTKANSDYILNVSSPTYSIETFVGNDDRLYYAFSNNKYSLSPGALVLGYVDSEEKFQDTDNDNLFIYNLNPATTAVEYNTIAVASYQTENYILPIFFTDVEDQITDHKNILAIKNNIFTEFTLKVSGSEKYYKHAALEPFFAPGILYNTIKSGIAVDWPCATGSNTAIEPYGGNTIVNAYYPKAFEMASYSGSVIQESSYGLLKSNIDYRIPFERLIFPDDAFAAKQYQETDLVEITPIDTLSDESEIVRFISQNYIYGGYEPYISPVDFSDIDNAGPKRFSVPFVYRKNNSSDTGLYTLAMSNFLAETVKFFLKDEKMTTFVSDPDYKWKEFNSNKTYYMDIVLEKSPDLVMMEAYHSDLHPTGSNGEKMNGRYFGYPINKTDKAIWGGEDFTAEEKKLIHNDPAYAPYTPPYFEGIARVRIAFKPQVSGKYTLQEVFDNATVENIFSEVIKGATTGSDAYINAMPINSSIDIFGAAQAVEVTIDETTGEQTVRELQNAQNWIISPRMETPVLDFFSQQLTPYENNYSKTGGFGRGMWSGYGLVPTEGKGIKVRLEDPFSTKPSPNTGSLLNQVGLRPEERNVGQVADSKLISEAVLVIPYLDQTTRSKQYSTAKKNKTDFEFIKISRTLFEKQLDNYRKGKPAISPGDLQGVTVESPLQSTSITQMVEKLEKYVIPPEMNFLEYKDIDPFVMYVMEFEHVLDQQDLVDIWQGLMPKISYTPELDSVSITHQSAPYELWEGKEMPENLRWMVFKVKRKAEYNYFNVTATTKDDTRFNFNKIIGRKEGTDVYSYNWPYDFFSLVEFAKVELQLDYKKK
jgi:hypothetical protein